MTVMAVSCKNLDMDKIIGRYAVVSAACSASTMVWVIMKKGKP
jgi:hypothetical protein